MTKADRSSLEQQEVFNKMWKDVRRAVTLIVVLIIIVCGVIAVDALYESETERMLSDPSASMYT